MYDPASTKGWCCSRTLHSAGILPKTNATVSWKLLSDFSLKLCPFNKEVSCSGGAHSHSSHFLWAEMQILPHTKSGEKRWLNSHQACEQYEENESFDLRKTAASVIPAFCKRKHIFQKQILHSRFFYVGQERGAFIRNQKNFLYPFSNPIWTRQFFICW